MKRIGFTKQILVFLWKTLVLLSKYWFFYEKQWFYQAKQRPGRFTTTTGKGETIAFKDNQ